MTGRAWQLARLEVSSKSLSFHRIMNGKSWLGVNRGYNFQEEYALVTISVAFSNFGFRPQDTVEERLPQYPELSCLGKKERQMCSHP